MRSSSNPPGTLVGSQRGQAVKVVSEKVISGHPPAGGHAGRGMPGWRMRKWKARIRRRIPLAWALPAVRLRLQADGLLSKCNPCSPCELGLSPDGWQAFRLCTPWSRC